MDDLTRAIAEALADDTALTEAEWLDAEKASARIAAALAPLIEARVREARAIGAAGALTSFAHECLDYEDANLAAVRAMQWERQAEDVRADAWDEGYLRGTLDATSDLEPADIHSTDPGVGASDMQSPPAPPPGPTPVSTREALAILEGKEVLPSVAQPRCPHVSLTPWGPAQCALPSHDDGTRHAYSPSEAFKETEE